MRFLVFDFALCGPRVSALTSCGVSKPGVGLRGVEVKRSTAQSSLRFENRPPSQTASRNKAVRCGAVSEYDAFALPGPTAPGIALESALRNHSRTV
eukprot:351801-Rhodomonas_salina.1